MTSTRVGADALRALLDKQEIYEVLMRYCRAIDRCDDVLLRSVYHPDAIDQHLVAVENASSFCDRIMQFLREKIKSTQHSVSNVLIELDGDVACSEAYCHAFHRIEEEGEEYDRVVGCRYVDRFERRNGVWKIAERRVVYEWNRQERSAERRDGDWMDRLKGRRSQADVVYEGGRLGTGTTQGT